MGKKSRNKNKPKPRLCQCCDSTVATSVSPVDGKPTRLCDYCSERLGIEEQEQYNLMRSVGC